MNVDGCSIRIEKIREVLGELTVGTDEDRVIVVEALSRIPPEQREWIIDNVRFIVFSRSTVRGTIAWLRVRSE